jgi:hypothetical protein
MISKRKGGCIMGLRQTTQLLCAMVPLILCAEALAQGPKEWRQTETDTSSPTLTLRQRYTGVVPGQGNSLPRVQELKEQEGTWVVWPGFILLENGGSRLFLQATEPLRYSIQDKGTRVTLSIKNAKVFLSNNRNPLVTTHFNTPIKRAYLKKHKKDVRLVLELKVNTTPEISQMTDADGYHYLFVDFAPGNYPIIDTAAKSSSFAAVGKTRNVDEASPAADTLPVVESPNP